MTDTILYQATQMVIDELNLGRIVADQTRAIIFRANPTEETCFTWFDGTRRTPVIQLSLEVTTALAKPEGIPINQRSVGIAVATEIPDAGAGTAGAITDFVSQNLGVCIAVVGGYALDFVNENRNPNSGNDRFWRIAA